MDEAGGMLCGLPAHATDEAVRQALGAAPESRHGAMAVNMLLRQLPTAMAGGLSLDAGAAACQLTAGAADATAPHVPALALEWSTCCSTQLRPPSSAAAEEHGAAWSN
jgi:hypothetical protein